METVGSCSSSAGDRNRDMERLTEAFGSSLSFEAIASAYSKAGLNIEMAGVILYELQENTSVVSKVAKDELHEVGVAGGECMRSTLSQNESLRSENSSRVLGSVNVKDDDMYEDIGAFLFQMLGDGFQLGMEKINEVLGICGYDLEKSMETLVDISASTLEKSDDVVSGSASAENESYQEIGPYYCYEKSPLTDDAGPRLVKQNTKDQRKKSKNNSNLQAEILGALFTAPERVEEQPPKRIIPRARVKKSVLYGRSVAAPPKEIEIEQSFVAVKSLADDKEDEDGDENSFPVLRQAVREHWVTMKEYYKAAVDAYTKGDKERAGKLMKEGQFFNKLAREADEKSVNKLIKSRPDEEMLLDFSTFEPREAIKLLKLHLSNLAGIPGIRYLKVGVQNADGLNKKGALKRLVLKLLEKESIECTETDDGKTLVIRLDEINPQGLSFGKKQEVNLPDV